MKIDPLGAKLFHGDGQAGGRAGGWAGGRAEGQTDRHDEANSSFKQFCECS